MNPRARQAILLALVAVVIGAAVLIVAVGGAGLGRAGTETADGVVVAIDSAGLFDVRGFTIRGADGELKVFVLGQLENATTFPPGHLAEHQAGAVPVRVTYRDEGGTLVAIRLEDSP